MIASFGWAPPTWTTDGDVRRSLKPRQTRLVWCSNFQSWAVHLRVRLSLSNTHAPDFLVLFACVFLVMFETHLWGNAILPESSQCVEVISKHRKFSRYSNNLYGLTVWKTTLMFQWISLPVSSSTTDLMQRCLSSTNTALYIDDRLIHIICQWAFYSPISPLCLEPKETWLSTLAIPWYTLANLYKYRDENVLQRADQPSSCLQIQAQT